MAILLTVIFQNQENHHGWNKMVYFDDCEILRYTHFGIARLDNHPI
jgi:hypothetical protein